MSTTSRRIGSPPTTTLRSIQERRSTGRSRRTRRLEDVAVAGVTMDAHLGADYLAAVRPTLDRQLAVAGLRLARMLNEALK